MIWLPVEAAASNARASLIAPDIANCVNEV
jgi:hypothetical protein